MPYDLSDTEIISQNDLIENFDDIIDTVTDDNEPIRILTESGNVLVIMSEKEFYNLAKQRNKEEEY